VLDGNAVYQNARQQNRASLYRKLNGGIGEKLNDWNGLAIHISGGCYPAIC